MTRPLRATYRLQFHAGFTFADAAALVPYLDRLGVSHLYASPLFAARPGSTHGYDGVDPNRLNPALGTEAEFDALVAALHGAGMGLILDIVPNHMAVARENRLLQAALCLGPDSAAARVFDIDWRAGRICLPFLGAPPDEAMGDIALERDDSGLLMATYHEHGYALRPATTAALIEGLDRGLAALWRRLEEHPDPDRFAEATAGLAALDAAALAGALDAADLPAVLAAQHWRLAAAATAADTLHHRRFFNITGLIGVRVEDPEVFALTHRLAIELVRSGAVDGLRIDHIDGLADPETYCRRLRAAIGPEATIHVEKILGHGESLPDWPVDGTTGYERLNEINRLFVDAEGHARFDNLLIAHRVLQGSLSSRLAAAKRLVLEELFRPELDRLVTLGSTLDGAPPPDALRGAVLALLVGFPVYRSYVTERGWSDADRDAWATAVAAAQAGDQPGAEAAAQLVELLQAGGHGTAAFLIRFQQLSGPAMAKGLEDTELYRSVALASVNEVGCEPDIPAADADETHAAIAGRLGDRTLIPLATHDTKRGADTRARLNLISHAPEAWIDAVARAQAAAAPIRETPLAPDPLDSWLIFQTLFGTWPIAADRLEAYVAKALREARRHSSWDDPDPGYEAAACAFARRLIDDPAGAAARDEILAGGVRRALPGRINGLAQTILQLTQPGVPDIYQGSELWDHSLVDPDNRRPVDFAQRRRLIEEPLPPLAEDAEGVCKLALIRALLGLRRRDPELFLAGAYAAVPAGREGFALLRRSRQRALLAAVPLRGGTVSFALAPDLVGVWQDLLTGAPVEIVEGFRPADGWPFLLVMRGDAGAG